MLNSSLPKGKGLNKLSYYHEKFGQERFAQIVPRTKQAGDSVGINFSYGGFIGNTFDSHRLIWKAYEEGGSKLQDKVVESLFKAYFEDEKSLGERSILKECAETAGMDASRFLEDESIGKEETLREIEEFKIKHRVSGVPFFIFDGKYTLSGAQPPEAILSVFEKIL